MPEPLGTEKWQVLVACDIALGQLFGPTGRYAGHSVEVDPETIKAALTSIDPGGGGTVLFEARHDNSVPPNEEGRVELIYREDGMISYAQVAIGGGIQAALRDPTIKRKVDQLVDSAGWLNRNTDAGKDEIQRTIAELVEAEQKIHDEQRLQTLAMHELQHAADFQAPKTYKQIMRSMWHQSLFNSYIDCIDLVAQGVATVYAYEALRNQLDQPLTIVILGTTGVWGAMGHMHNKLASRLKYAINKYSWGEKRARRRETKAEDLSKPIIYLSRIN